MSVRLLIVGAGGHARVVARLAILTGWEIAAILDRRPPAEVETIEGVSVSGPFAAAAQRYAAGVRHAVLAVGDNDERAQLSREFAAQGFAFPVLRHPSAIVEGNAAIGPGTIICAGAIVGTLVQIGAHAIINTGAIADHECVIADHAHLAPGTRLAGRVHIGERAMIGIGTCVREKQRIGVGTIIGAGSIVVDDIPDNVVAFGQPARVMRSSSE
jgi:sugar O-acyltransferase (sialic acid O-acetyltransferase NeuD family)